VAPSIELGHADREATKPKVNGSNPAGRALLIGGIPVRPSRNHHAETEMNKGNAGVPMGQTIAHRLEVPSF